MPENPTRPADCKEIFAALSDYLDRQLPAGDCAQIEAHIANCPPCIEFVESLKKSIELCRQSHTPQELPPLAEDVRAKLLAAYQQTRGRGGKGP